MNPILKNENLQKSLSEKGYVIVPFLNNEEVEQLKTVYYTHHPTTLEGMYATAHTHDLTLRTKMNEEIKNVFALPINKYFCNENALGGSFIAKGKGLKSVLNPHQDWNIVDEEEYCSYNIWVPLVNLHSENGAIQIIQGSHLWQKTYRSGNIGFAYQDELEEINRQLVPLYMQAGEALIYDHRLIHASGVNTTDEIRLAAVFGVIPNDAQMLYYHKNDQEDIEVYESNKEFFLFGNIFEGPQNLKKIKTIIAPHPWLTISIPAYNDEQSLTKLISECIAVCKAQNILFEIFIVNDGSQDNTQLVIDSFQKQYKNIHSRTHETNLGFGPTLKEVFSIPKTEWVLFLPGDNQFPATNISLLLKYKEDYDFILGKRSIRKDSLLRLFYAGFYNQLVSLLTGYKVEDVNGIALFKSSLLDSIKFKAKTSFVHAEFFLEAKRLGFNVLETKIEHKEREFGQGSGGKWSVIVPIVIDFFFYIFRKKRNERKS